MFGNGVLKMTENTNTTSNATTKPTTCKCYERGREDMRNAVLEMLNQGIYQKEGLEPLRIDSVASQSMSGVQSFTPTSDAN